MATAREYTPEQKALFEEIKNGRTFDKGEELPEFYRKHLTNLLWMQGDSEYSGAMGYMPWIEKAPTLREKVIVAQIVKDEMRHASVIYKILEDLGHDTIKHVENTELEYKLEEDEINIGFKRLKDDYRVNIFYYNINHWTDFILFNFLMDRAAGHQLEDTLQSSYLPWKKGIEGIYKEEVMHLTHGDKWVKILAQEADDKKFLQERLNLWWPRVMNVFGSTRGAANDLYVNLGLKARTNGEVRDAFVKEIQVLCDEVGLVIPEYKEEDQPKRDS
ncbi:putative phenylacetic acid degradation protein [Halobacteriovorax marinus SJ]|uniref:Phenylacetic acid degradation protein n=1 Tax=Halobacteriovorax marinus (strain ATCC BAA-682 / DSM 15412 / SJ) TaxID=862908 RepID=E1X2Y5_HALMS|nr:Phenylacetic acid catabolic protein [Halobacteriovorax marinus]CBW26815.1 putative phenylacetic acid degradation protein [Halobacteriovorax marinus SJ]